MDVGPFVILDELPPGPPYAFISFSDLITWWARFGLTPKLCIDGHEYRRRQRRRTKRKQRR